MKRLALGLCVIATLVLSGAAVLAQTRRAPDWIRFRGPNGSGVSAATNIPTEFGPEKNVVWRLELPTGHSSPILFEDRVYVTSTRDKALVLYAIDRLAGKILWERTAPAEARPPVDKRNNPASPSVAVDATGVYVFFPDFGLIAYDQAGKEIWRHPLGPFTNIYGMGASPVIVGDQLLLSCDQSIGSFLLSVDKKSGKQRWKTARPEATSGHATPILWRAPNGRDQILLPGSFLLTAYDVDTGARIWWVRGLSWEIKSTPVIAGDTLFINGYGSPEGEVGKKIVVPPSDEVWQTADADKNGTLSKTEFPKYSAAFWFDVADLDHNGTLTKSEWEYYRAALDSENGMLAIRLGGSGDMTEKSIKWKYRRSVPQLPSPLFYRNVLYMVNDNGIVTSLNPETGEMIAQGRLTGALGSHYASPVAADGHVFFSTEPGAVVVLEPTGDLKPLVVNTIGEEIYATPAFADGRIYVRTTKALWAFGAK
jgi:outer membrane protein assembly factor BamB